MTSTDNPDRPPQRLHRRRVAFTLLSTPIFFSLLLFLPAGTWAWTKGWLFILVFFGTIAVVLSYLWRVNPDVVIARSHRHQGTKRWDRVVLNLFIVTMWGILPVAALDDARFHWYPLPWWVCGIGHGLFVVGFGIVTWAETVNKFFEVTVRLQTDRGHKVIDNGPYAIVRHPGYVGGIMIIMGMALALGSLWALIPAGLASLLLMVRTQWEDQMLQMELPGYREYTQRVRYRLISGVW